MKRKERKKQSRNTSIRSKQLQPAGVSMDMETSWAAQEIKSNLNNMARFQQKQLQEKEQKLLQLYDQQQQRAYQVVQRGSAGSNGSNHATSISQHTVTKTSSSSHTTSTSQGGKVRQMFDERRQTTVKGIDRSYPLEPLENKSRKQANGNGVQKNGNSTVNRQSVTVKRVARADVNSNLNGGKPIVSYHEEITRESLGPSARQHQEDDEFGNENHVAQYANGNHRDETHIEEVLDEDMIERNRMMAKLHLMEYDETLKHRVKNDLESEEFPEDFMVDVPDKLPKQSVTKKLSQAEVRLERFKNANARRGNNVTKNPAIAPKKRSDPIFPAKSTSSGSRMTKTGSHDASGRRSSDGKNPANGESTGKTVGRNVGRRDENPRFFSRESEKSVTACAVDSRTARKLSPDLSKDRLRRGERSRTFNEERSAVKYPIDREAARTWTSESFKDKTRRRESGKLSCKDAGKSAVTSATDVRAARKLPAEASRDGKDQGDRGEFVREESVKSATAQAIDSKAAEKFTKDTKDFKRRSESPKFFCKESERSATTYAIDAEKSARFSFEGLKDVAKRGDGAKPTTCATKSAERSTREVSEDTKGVKRRSESPKFLCKESERSGTTYATDSKLAGKLTRVSLKDMKDVKRRSESPRFFCRESEGSATTYAIDSKAADRLISEPSKGVRDVKRRDESPRFFCRESEGSATTYAIDSKAADRLISEPSKGVRDVKRRDESPRFFCRESERSATTYAIDPKTASPNSSKTRTPRSDSRKFFCEESEKSATTYTTDSTILPTTPNYMKDSKSSVSKIESKNKRNTPDSTMRKSANDAMNRRATFAKRDAINKSSSPESSKYDVITCAKRQTLPKSTETKLPDVFERLTRERSSSPRSFCRQGKRLATTMSIRDRDTGTAPVSPDLLEESIKKRGESGGVAPGKRDAATLRADESKSPDLAKVSSRGSSASPQYFGSDSDRSASILMVTPETIVKPKTELACYDEPTGRFIRNSVSRFFSEQREGTTRNVEPRGHVRSAEIDVNRRSFRGSCPLSLTGARTPSPTKPQFDDERAEKDERTTSIDADGSRYSSPRCQEIVESREGTPGFRYETVETAIATSLKPRISTLDVVEQPPKGAHSLKQTVAREITAKPRNLPSNVKDRSPKSPSSVENDNLTAEDARTFSRRGSAGVLRSTKLIRDVLQRQSGRDRVDYASDGISSEWEERSGADSVQTETTVDRKVEERAGTPAARQLAAAASKSCRSAEVDTEIRGIRTPDRDVRQQQFRGTYSRSSKETACEKSNVDKLLTYSVRRPVKQRGSLFESKIFERSARDRDSQRDKRPVSWERKTRNASLKKQQPVARARSSQSGTKGNAADGKSESDVLKAPSRTASLIRARGGKTSSDTVAVKSNVDRYEAAKRITRTSNESIARDSKRRTDMADRSGETRISRARAQTTRKESIVDERKRGKASKQTEILKSMELVRAATRGSDFTDESGKMVGESVGDCTVRDEQIETRKSCWPWTIDVRKSEAGLASIKELSKNYERTDSVESALRRFDSIGTEAGSIPGTSQRSVESIPKEIRTRSGGNIGREARSKTISPKALDRPNVNVFAESEPSRRCAKKAPTVSRSTLAADKGRQAETQETRRQNELEGARDSIEIGRIAVRSRSLSCKRKLFQHADSSEAGSVASRCSLDSVRTVERLSTGSNKKETRDSVNTASKRFEFPASDETSTETIDKGETDKTSTGVDRCSSAKQPRSIKDIRSSIDDESWQRETGQASMMSAIAGSESRRLRAAKAAGRSQPRRINIDNRAANRKEISLPGRWVNVAASNDALGDTDRSSVKCTMRFSRVAKSPSPETTKETSIRARRNVPASPSKSPDTVARRASSELKAQDTRSTKRPTAVKGTEPIGSRKTTTATSTSTKKSADVVDGAILENGLHLRDQTAETKYDNDSPTKKSVDASVVDLDEQPPKENDAPLPRKPLLRKQSTEKQITSMQSTRPPSVSSISGGSAMQGQTSGSRSKMASRAKTPISGSTAYKGSASSRTGGAASATCYSDALVPCKMCGRRFAQDRVTLHEQICAKTTQKKRKQFDTMMYRVKGTDLEPFVKKGLVKKQVEKSKKPEIKSNWRRKHEDFINAIRSAKQVQAHLAAGGKLSDLPPPPVSDNYDYIQCPHCGRKFNKAAAERHIPKCEHMLHNKPIHSRAPKPRR